MGGRSALLISFLSGRPFLSALPFFWCVSFLVFLFGSSFSSARPRFVRVSEGFVSSVFCGACCLLLTVGLGCLEAAGGGFDSSSLRVLVPSCLFFLSFVSFSLLPSKSFAATCGPVLLALRSSWRGISGAFSVFLFAVEAAVVFLPLRFFAGGVASRTEAAEGLESLLLVAVCSLRWAVGSLMLRFLKVVPVSRGVWRGSVAPFFLLLLMVGVCFCLLSLLPLRPLPPLAVLLLLLVAELLAPLLPVGTGAALSLFLSVCFLLPSLCCPLPLAEGFDATLGLLLGLLLLLLPLGLLLALLLARRCGFCLLLLRLWRVAGLLLLASPLLPLRLLLADLRSLLLLRLLLPLGLLLLLRPLLRLVLLLLPLSLPL